MSPARHTCRLLFGAGCVLLAVVALRNLDAAPQQPEQPQTAAAADPQFTAEQLEFFEKRVRPVLAERCYSCHGPEKQESGLRVDSRAALLTGGDSGPSLVPGDLEAGYFVDAVRYGDIYQMPKDGKLPQEQIDDLVAWVKMGAPWPKEALPSSAPSPKEEFDLAKRARHWSFLQLVEPVAPHVARADWSRTWIDDYILAKLESASIAPSPQADRATWLRRVTFDLVGLPPTPEEFHNFLGDESPQAFERVVDRLLDSPHYGERWGRHWLDLVRYAETAGHEFDYDIAFAYKYRDYVIRAFNADVPYDQFVREHIAGDLLDNPRRMANGDNESILATGFWWLGEGKHSPVDIRGEEADRMDNQLDVFGKAFLGLTIACARCHDHKFDAISTRDYYALAGYLQSSRYHLASIDRPGPRRRAMKALAELAPERDQQLRDSFLSQLDVGELQRGMLAAEAAIVRNANPQVEQSIDTAIHTVSETDLKPWLDQKLAADVAPRWAAAARVFEMPDAQLSKWRNELIVAARQPDHPLHAWANVALGGQSGKTGVELDRPFSTRWEKFSNRNAQTNKLAPGDESTIFADFSTGVPADWFTTDEAFGPESSSGESLAWSGSNAPQAIPPRVVHSGRLSHRLQGTLRSATFEIRSPKILYRLAGSGTTLNLIIDGFQRIRDPIYGGLTFGINHGELRWHAQDVSKWIGHRAYVEIIDDGAGWAAIEQVCFGERVPPQSAATEIAQRITAASAINSSADLAQAMAQQLAAPVSESALVWLANSGLVPFDHNSSQLTDMEKRRRALDAQLNYAERALTMIDGSGVNEYVFLRGNHKTTGDLVPRRFLEAFCNQPAENPGSGRRELAERMTEESRALLARVMVNRVWQHHFGRALAATPDNLGRLGDPPIHPELLDALAGAFIGGGWKLKPLHRAMVLSATYRQQSGIRPELAEHDPNNKLWHRMPVRRLEAEAIRDAILAASGRLDLENMFGPSVPPHLTPFMQGRGRPGQSGPLDGEGRRSIYLNVRRNFLSPFLSAFDYPTPFTTIGRRGESNVPAQSLALMNDPFVLGEAERWAQRIIAEHPRDARPELSREQVWSNRLNAMWLQAFGRTPEAGELKPMQDYLVLRHSGGGDETAAWSEVAHALLNSKQFIFLR